MPSSASASEGQVSLRGWLALALCAVLVLLAGCASRIPDTVDIPYTPEQLLPARAPFMGPEDAQELVPVDLLALDAEMRAFLAEIEQRSGNQRVLMANLLKSLLDSGAVNLQYHNLKTYTARETFHAREGNCLSFTNLFVALAREAGLEAHFQEVKVPHNWERQGDTWVYNRHINVWVDLSSNDQYIIDFNVNVNDAEHERNLISDDEALAQYHNNMGVYWLLQQRYDLAYLHLREAISLAGREAYFWTNLGALYNRAGDSARAEAAWLHALEIGQELSASSNLARLYRNSGRPELAAHFEDQVEVFRRRNPYYLYELAETAYYQGDYETSIDTLESAIRRRDDEEQFYRLLGLNYIMLGDTEKASKAMSKAETYARSDSHKRRYARKIELLGGGP